MGEFVKAASTSEIPPGQARVSISRAEKLSCSTSRVHSLRSITPVRTRKDRWAREKSWATRLPVRGMARRSTSGRERSSVRQLMKTLRAITYASLEPTSRSRFSEHHEAHAGDRGVRSAISQQTLPKDALACAGAFLIVHPAPEEN